MGLFCGAFLFLLFCFFVRPSGTFPMIDGLSDILRGNMTCLELESSGSWKSSKGPLKKTVIGKKK